MLKATLKGVLAHKVRLLLTALAVVLGVGFVAGTYVLTDTLNATFDNLFDEVTQGVDVSVRAVSGFGDETSLTSGRDTVPDTLQPVVAAVDGVRVADGSVAGYAQYVDKEGKSVDTGGAPTLGVNWTDVPELNPLRLRDGRAPRGPTEVLMDAGTAKKYDFGVGDKVRILFQGPPGDFTIVGIAGFGAADNLAGATLAVFDTPTTQRVLDKVGRFDSVDVVGDDSVSPLDLRTRVQAALPDGYEALTGTQVADEQSGQIKDALGFFSTFLLVFAGISLFVGAFMILNTFSILVAQRTRELGLLRALGASRGQVLASVVGEAALVGLVASAAGVGLGILVAMGLKALLSAFGIDLPGGGLIVKPRTIVISLVVGELVTLVAATVPALRASKLTPMAALGGAGTDGGGSLRRRTVAGALVLAAGVAALGTGLFGDAGISLVGLGAALTFIGVALLMPLIAGPMASVLGRPLPRIFWVRGISATLARQNALRNPRRTASTAAALTIGLGLVGCVAVLAASIVESGAAVIDKALAADYIVSTDQFTPTISTEVAQRLSQQPELGGVTGLQTGEFKVHDSTTSLYAGDPDTLPQLLNIEMVTGDLAGLGPGEVIVEEKEADDEGVGVGDVLPVTFARTGDKELRVAGTYQRNQLLGQYTVSTETFLENFSERLDFVVLTKAAPGVSQAAARAAVDRVAEDFPNVEVRDQVEFKAEQKRQIRQALGLVTALLFLAVIIAFLGIINTLALSVFERTRELGLLRAVGMARGQVRGMIRGESVIISVMGALIGLAIGVLFGWAVVANFSGEGVSELVIPVGQLVFYVVIAGVLGVIAALLPARRAARLDVLEAISHE
ncbi:MAG: putative transport system permease protein [Actinomycetota bacterium]|nr:putative transport system permease protein [Actinomycetota bacterium]